MPFDLEYSESAGKQYRELERSKDKKQAFKAVVKTLRLLADNPRHPGLRTHEYSSFQGPDNQKAFEAYAQNNMPGAYRIFFCYHPPKSRTIRIIAILPHP